MKCWEKKRYINESEIIDAYWQAVDAATNDEARDCPKLAYWCHSCKGYHLSKREDCHFLDRKVNVYTAVESG